MAETIIKVATRSQIMRYMKKNYVLEQEGRILQYLEDSRKSPSFCQIYQDGKGGRLLLCLEISRPDFREINESLINRLALIEGRSSEEIKMEIMSGDGN